MSASSNYLEDKLLDHVLRGGASDYPNPGNVFLALFSGTASDVLAALEAGTKSKSGSANWGHYEINNAGYSREQLTFGTDASGGSISTTGNATFTTATANYNNSAGSGSTVTCIAVMDTDYTADSSTESLGNVLFYGQLDNAKEILNGDTFQVSTGNLTISLA